ncbi:MAG: RNA polymerase sigma-54 factor [Bdellovibrionales bacterium GWA2_49_15]|nr:MAG: RNA polymerase sigma-54 factor [Bdellovibrionales bacterium GWA2_49_15]HAZ13711.1 RNA polymerase sigma-54 factor [Bdellovibrionales bacterium]
MAMKLTQGLRQMQNLMMTPQLQQAIKLLTLTHLEMTNVIAQEMVENPVLEEISEGDEQNEETTAEHLEEDKLTIETAEAKTQDFESPTVFEKDDFDWNSYIENYNSTSSSGPTPQDMASPDPDETPSYENMMSKSISLPEHLEWQLRMEDPSEQEWNVAQRIIHNLDNCGYLQTTMDEIIAEVGVEREMALEVLKTIKRLDPVGCGSTTLEECLIAQAELLEQRSPLVEKIIREFLPLLQKKDYEKMSKEIGVSKEKLKEAELIIQTFNPKPGLLVSEEETQYVTPDIYVQEMGGEFVVQVNDDGVPRLRISNLYQSLMKKGSEQTDEKAKEYVKDKVRSALWLIKSIQNRQRTIIKVAKAIVRQQRDFFKKGPAFLRPMVLKDVAEEIGMHESTVSRVTTNKYMHTPIGTFELKYFFSSGIGKEGGTEISSEALKLRIKKMIEGENPKRPLSDQKIAEVLSREDLQVARRTVAKYRELLRIPSSADRKAKGEA